jgi:DNA gyrase subunit A
VQVFEGDEAILISDQGTLVRTRTNEVSILGRNTQGVTLIKVQEGEKLVQVARVAESVGNEDLESGEEEGVDGTEASTISAEVTQDAADSEVVESGDE